MRIARIGSPYLFKTKWHGKHNIREVLLDLEDRGMGKVIIVTVTYDNDVDLGEVLNEARSFSISLWS